MIALQSQNKTREMTVVTKMLELILPHDCTPITEQDQRNDCSHKKPITGCYNDKASLHVFPHDIKMTEFYAYHGSGPLSSLGAC